MYLALRKRYLLWDNEMDENRVLTLKQASKVIGVAVETLHKWVQAGFLKVAPKWGKEHGDRVFFGDLLDCINGQVKGSRQPKDRRWYSAHIARVRFRRSIRTAEQVAHDNALVAAACRRYRARKRALKDGKLAE